MKTKGTKKKERSKDKDPSKKKERSKDKDPSKKTERTKIDARTVELLNMPRKE